MKVVIYDKVSGDIHRTFEGPPFMVDCQCAEGEEFYLNPPNGTVRIVDNIPVVASADIRWLFPNQ